MSMLCTLSRVTPEQVEAMRRDPAAAAGLLHDTLFQPRPKPGLFARLLGRPAPPAAQPSVCWIGPGQQYALDKQWHVLHFLLTGQAEGGDFPAAFLCEGGEELGVDLGYGPPRLFTHEQARRIASHLDSVTPAQLRARYSAAEIERQGIYWQAPASVDEQDEDLEALHETTVEAARFIGETARLGRGLVIEIH